MLGIALKVRLPLLESLFALASLLAGFLFSYSGLMGNSSLLGQSRDFGSYLSAIAYSSSYISVPLLIGSACAFFIEPGRLPWLALALALAAAATAMSMEPSFIFLLFYPFSIVVAWVVGLRCLSQTKSFLALPFFILVVGLVLSAVITYAESSEGQAESMAKALCGRTHVGSKFEDVLTRANHDEKNRQRVRWVQIFESVKSGEGKVDVVYRGTNLLRQYKCEITVSAGFVRTADYSVNEPK